MRVSDGIGRPSDTNDKTLTILEELSLDTGECALILPRRNNAPDCAAVHTASVLMGARLERNKNTRVAQATRVSNLRLIRL